MNRGIDNSNNNEIHPIHQVIRNKLLFKYILNHIRVTIKLDDNKCLIGRPYKCWTHITEILLNQHVHLLYDKVIRGEYLYLQSDSIELICSRVTDLNIFKATYARYQYLFLSRSLIYHSIQGGNVDIVRILLKQTEPIRLTPFKAWDAAIDNGSVQIIKLLLEEEIPIPTYIKTDDIIRKSLKSHSNDTFLYWKENRPDWVQSYQSTINQSTIHTMECGHIHAIKMLMFNGIEEQLKKDPTFILPDEFKSRPVILFIDQYESHKHHSIPSTIEILEYLLSLDDFIDFKLDFSKTKQDIDGTLRSRYNIPGDQFQLVWNDLTLIQIFMDIYKVYKMQKFASWIALSIVGFGITSLTQWIIDNKQMFSQYDIISAIGKEGNLDMLKMVLSSLGIVKDFVVGAIGSSILKRKDEESDIMVDYMCFNYSFDMNAPFEQITQNPINNHLSMTKLVEFHKRRGSKLWIFYLNLKYMTMDQLKYLIDNSTNHDTYQNLYSPLLTAIYLNDLVTFQYWISNSPISGSIASEVEAIMRYGRYHFIPALIGYYYRYDPPRPPPDVASTIFLELGKRGDLQHLSSYLPLTSDRVKDILEGAMSSESLSVINYFMDGLYKSNPDNLCKLIGIEKVIKFGRLDILQHLCTLNIGFKNQLFTPDNLRKNVLYAIDYGRLDFIYFLLKDLFSLYLQQQQLNSNNQNNQEENEINYNSVLESINGKDIQSISSNTIFNQFLLDYIKKNYTDQSTLMVGIVLFENLDMFAYLIKIGYPFNPKLFTSDTLISENQQDIFNIISPTVNPNKKQRKQSLISKFTNLFK